MVSAAPELGSGAESNHLVFLPFENQTQGCSSAHSDFAGALRSQ